MAHERRISEQLGVDRQTFLSKVREALGRAQTVPPPAPPAVDESLVRLAAPGDDLLEMFCARAAAVGMKVSRTQSEQLIRHVQGVLETAGVKRLAVALGTLPQGLPLKDALRRKGMEVVDWSATPGLEAQFDLDAGVTDVHAAIAETGTLVCASDAGHSRGLSLVPPTHVAIVRRSDVLPDLLDYTAKTRGRSPEELPASIALITGPSKTADIEGVLITGVHGPGLVHVVVVEDA